MDPRKLSSQELLRRCLDSQDEACWTEFVRRFQPLIAAVVTKCLRRRMRPDLALVDDLVHETYIKLCSNDFKALRNFDFRHENAFFGFLKVVARNAVQDHFRKYGDGGDEEDLDKVSPFLPSNPGPMSLAERETLIGEINRCLAKLSGQPNFDRDYMIFWFYYRHGLTAKAIAALPGIELEVKGVESVLLRLTRYLGEELNRPRHRRAGRG